MNRDLNVYRFKIAIVDPVPIADFLANRTPAAGDDAIMANVAPQNLRTGELMIAPNSDEFARCDSIRSLQHNGARATAA